MRSIAQYKAQTHCCLIQQILSKVISESHTSKGIVSSCEEGICAASCTTDRVPMLLSFSLPMALNCDPSWLQLWPPCSPICSPSAPQLQCVLFLQVDAYLLDLEVDELPGVGWNMCHKLKDLGIASVRHVRGSSKDMLQKELGSKTGATRIAMPPPCACTCTCALLPGPWAIWPECCFMALLTAGASISCTRNPPPPPPPPSPPFSPLRL